MPYLDESFLHDLENRLLSEELGYNRVLMKEERETLHRKLNKEQLHAYNSVLDSVDNNRGGFFNTNLEVVGKIFFGMRCAANYVV